jgi:TRAP-type uncharacterized transport system substrate-binding protein
MPPGLPNRPSLAMRFWLAQRFGRGGSWGQTQSTAEGHSSGLTMSIESLEHLVRSRVRMFLRHTWLVAILGGAVAGGCIWAGVHYSIQPTVMRIAAGPAGSSNAKLVDVLGKLIAQSHERMQLEYVPTENAAASAQALVKGQADLAVVPTTVGRSADWPVVAILRQNVMAFILPAPPPPPPPPAAAPSATTAKAAKPATAAKGAKATKAAAATPAPAPAKSTKAAKSAKADDSDDDDDDSDSSSDDSGKPKIKIADLAGKRIGIVTGSEATADLLHAVLNHYGVPLDKVQESPIDPQSLAAAVKNNTVDVLFVAGSATGEAISDAVAAAAQFGAPTFIGIDQADGLSKRNPAFDSIDIDAGTFGGVPPMPGSKLKSLSFAEYLVARKGFNHSSIADLSKLIYTSRLAIASQMGGEVKIEAPSTDKDADVLAHPGTLDYLNDNQQSFFDKYGDDIFYGMLIFPVFGSAIAGVASYLLRDSRTRRLRLLQHVLDLIRKAHAAQTLDIIDRLQIDADNLVIAIIHQSEHEEFNETVRMSFSFALDQLRFAIGARRAAIIDQTAPSAGTAVATDGAKAAAA